MFETSFSIYNLEFFLAVLVRIAGAVSTAPVFNSRSVPARVRLFLACSVAMLVVGTLEYEPLRYTTTFGFTAILLKELVTGLSIGLMASVSMAMINMAGQFIDREIGFSMASTFDQVNGGMSTITADFYNYLVMLVMVLSGMHYFILVTLADSFQVIPIGGAMWDGDAVYTLVLELLRDYFIISLRICMPIFLSATLLNVVLGILAKASPQLSMFTIGMQLKVLLGLLVIFLTIAFMPDVTQYVYEAVGDFVSKMIQTMYE